MTLDDLGSIDSTNAMSNYKLVETFVELFDISR